MSITQPPTIRFELTTDCISSLSQPHAALWLRMAEEQIASGQLDCPASLLLALQRRAMKLRRNAKKRA